MERQSLLCQDQERFRTENEKECIQKDVGSDLFKIETVKKDAADYYACIDDAQEELRADAANSEAAVAAWAKQSV